MTVPHATDPSPGFEVQLCTRGETVASEVASWVGGPLRDPFARQLVIVSSPGQARWLSQQVALTFGITAGVDFWSMDQVRHHLRDRLGLTEDGDPWSVPALALAACEVLCEVLDDPTPPGWADALRAHLRPGPSPVQQRPGRLWATAHRWARLVHRYSRLAPAMIEEWSVGNPVTVTGEPLADHERWQFELMRRCAQRIGEHHPRAQHQSLLEGLTRVTLDWERICVAALSPLRHDEREVTVALARATPLRCLQLVTRSEGQHPVLDPLQQAQQVAVAGWVEVGAAVVPAHDVDRAPTTVLGRLGEAILTGDSRTGPPDTSVQVLRSHGPDRQVEVLRDALCGLFEDDPTLEPRDVVIVCPDLPTYAPLLQASFGSRESDGFVHPGHQLRVQVPQRSGTGGPVHEVVDQLFSLVIGRAGAEDLNTLVSLPPVSRRFGFSHDDHERIRALVERARLRWGLDSRTRAELGMPGVPQGTWVNAIERMVAGATFAERPLTWVGTALPISHVEAGDLRLVGQLAELVSRVRWLDQEFRQAATAPVWAERIQRAVELFVDLPWDQQGAITATVAAVRRWASAAASSAPLDQHDVHQVMRTLAADWPSRPAFGNGAVHAVGWDELRGIPHRVVAVLGLDERVFPQHARRWGDDLLASQLDAEHDPRVQSQGALLTTLLAARQRFLVVHQGSDPRTGAPVEPPVAVAQLTAALQRVCPGFKARSMSLQPHSPVNFVSDPRTDEHPFSFDGEALAAAQALAQAQQLPAPAEPTPLQWRFPDVAPGAVALADLTGFWRNPARAMLRHAIGTSLNRDGRQSSRQVPLELWGLSEFGVGQQALEQLLAGATPEQVRTAAALGGDVPPGQLGRASLQQVMKTAADLAAAASEVPGEPLDQPLSLSLGRWQLSGVARMRHDTVFSVSYARLNGAALLESWLTLLAVSVALDSPLRARSLHLDSRTMVLQAPSPARCRDLLVDLLEWRSLGLGSILVSPVRLLHLVGQRSAAMPSEERAQLDKQIAREFRTLQRDDDWSGFLPPTQTSLLQAPVHADLEFTVAEFGDHLFAPIRKAMVLP
ncbi:exodeoxyribonuclease V subunit gamma [Aestuariimicrobium kwangyangense]|uniref:exodeoxyribonuclease V subunit gamma n=1 Tax=Aestuariimicrobium kwangyangense TaxID=396389 RepID=UPI00047B385B|nr:exodeoxyribonuclease V subunit gamma [Aestuariimicrobium kwangyangense]